MIKNLEIKNFKSIKHLKLNCKRINIFIGKPNTGKSNILETLGFLSATGTGGSLKDYIRLESMTNLFYDQNIQQKVEISIDNISFAIAFENGEFEVREYVLEGKSSGNKDGKKKKLVNDQYSYTIEGFLQGPISSSYSEKFKYYKYAKVETFKSSNISFLEPPDGRNLLTILQTHGRLKKVVSDIFSNYGFKIVFKPLEYKIEILKGIEEDILISYPYNLVSDTLQRVVFHLAAIETNKDSVIIFEEPEAHAFPYYTKFLAERISLDKNNQYFISTHNPYFLLSILEKTPKEDVGIFITYFESYQTKVKTLKEKDMTAILDLDASVFFNLDHFLEPE